MNLNFEEMLPARVGSAPVHNWRSAGMGSHIGASDIRSLDRACTTTVQTWIP